MTTSRKSKYALSIIVAATTLFGAATGSATAAAGFRSFEVDVSPLVRLGAATEATILRAQLPPALQRNFGAAYTPGDRAAPRLVVRVNGVSINSNGGAGSNGGGGTSDYVDATLTVVDGQGRVLNQRPLLSAIPSSSGGAWYLADNVQRRIAAIGENVAAWAPRLISP